MKTNRTIPEDARRAAVAAIAAGESVSKVANRLHVSEQAVRNWRARYGSTATVGRIRTQRATIPTLSNTDAATELRAVYEFLGRLTFEAWRKGQPIADETSLVRQLATMRPQMAETPSIQATEPHHATANGSGQELPV